MGRNVVSGDGGNDTIQAESWNHNELAGGTGHDAIVATLIQETGSSLDSNNILDGGEGNDFLSATGRVDTWGSDDEPPQRLHQPAHGRYGQRYPPGVGVRRRPWGPAAQP